MSLTDSVGYPVTGATPASLDAFEQATGEFLRMVGDPVASIDRAIAAAPEMTLAHVAKAWFFLIGTEPAARPVAAECCAAAAKLAANDRERRHLAAAQALCAGRWREAGRLVEDLVALYPLDRLAISLGHQIDFFRGDSRMLRDRIARVLPHWDASIPSYHAVLGMYAFGLEETGDYLQAEQFGRRAVELEPRDTWAWHAVAHSYEMRNLPREGIAWLAPNRATWSEGSFLAVHNTWHLALFQLELDDHAAALALYDEAIGGPGSSIVMELIDQTALLWRLKLRGVDVGDRFTAVSQRWSSVGGYANYAFNDFHAVIAHTAAGRADAEREVLDAQALLLAAATPVDNLQFTREVGQHASAALVAYHRGDYATTTRLLRDIRHHAHRFGGSHAQRDLIDLTLIDAAIRGGDQPLATALAAERLAMRPHSPLARRLATQTGVPGVADKPALALAS